MKEYKIYRSDEAIYEFVVDDTISKSLSGNKYVSFTISSKDELDLKIGDYIFVENEKYEIFDPVDIEESNGVFTYPLTFYFQGYKLNNSIITDEGATTFSYHGEVSDFMKLLIDSLNIDYPEFALGTIQNGSIIDLSFDNSNCMAALQTVCENAEMEWDITGTVITVKRRIGEETDYVFEYGRNKGSYSVKLAKVANASVTTRMIGKGGTLNIPADYDSPDSPKRLNLGNEVLEKNVEKYGKITGVYVNENIYPRLINKKVLDVTIPPNIAEAGSWKIKLDIPFNLSEYYAENEVPVVKFQTGDLTGLDFEIVENSWNNTNKTLSIIVKEEEDGYYIPNANRQPRVGDVFVLLNINMPQSYIDEATQELREATQNELNKKCEPQYAPSLSVQKHYIKKNDILLNIGDGITVKIGSRRITTRIIGLTETSDDIRVELGDQMLYTYDTKVNNTIEQIQFTLKQLINIDDIKRLFYNLINAWYPKWFNQKLHKDADVEFNSVKVADIVQSDNISSHDFTSGPLGSGHRIKDGNAEFQNVTVRGSISAFEYLIQQVKAVGGKLLVSGANMKVGAVEELEDGYKCSFNTDGGTIYNTFIAGDQAFHQVYNGQKKSRYWRLVTEIGSDYIVLSKTDCEAGSDVPQVGDEILQLGNRTDINRMSAIMLSAYDENSPYTAYYNGINSFSLVGKETMREGNLNGIVDKDFGQLSGFGMFADNVYLKGQFWLMSGKTVEQSIGEVQSNINNLQIGTENLISWKMMLEWNKKNKDIAVYGQDEDGVYLGVDQELLYLNVSLGSSIFKPIFDITFKPNTQYVFSIEWKLAGAQDYAGLWIRIFYTDGTTDGVIVEKDQTTKKISTIITEAGKTVSKISASYGTGGHRTFIYNISLIEGNKPLQGFPVATDDLPNNINLVNGTKEVVLEDSGTTHNYKTLSIPVIKPNTAYYISFNTEFLAGSSEKFTTNIWDKKVVNFLCYNNITTKQGGVIITKNDFTEQSGSLLIYAGIAGYTQGNSVKYTDIMLVEGRFPATAWTSSVNEQMNSIKTEVSAEIKAESDKINLSVSEKIANTRPGTVNYLNNSRFDNTSGWQYYDTIDIASDEYFGNVVEVYHSERINYQKDVTNDIGNINGLKNTELVYFVIAKKMSDGDGDVFNFGYYLGNKLNSNLCERIDLGNGWFQYWTTFKSENDLGNTIGIHDLTGRWRFFAAGILKGNLPTSWSPSLDDQGKYVDNKTYRTYLIDSRNLDQNKYYPVTIPVNMGIMVTIEVVHVMNGVGNPSWSTHESGFSLICRWKTNGSGWGTIEVSRIIEDYEYRYATVIPAGSIGQLTHSNHEYIYVRGGTIYEFKVYTGGGEPYLHKENWSIAGEDLTIQDSVTAPTSFQNETRASIQILKDSINLSVEAPRWASGTVVHGDPTFKNGINGVYTYNNSPSLTNRVERINKLPDSPIKDSDYNLKVFSSYESSPGGGGFYQIVYSRANAIFVHRFIAKIPEGYSIHMTRNQIGDGGYQKWATDNRGTGKWQEYIYITYCGSTGVFDNFGHVYLEQSATVEWYLAYSDIFDITEGISGNLINQINISKEGIRIAANRVEISGATIFRDSGGNQVNIFGSGDDVFSINNGVFRVDKNGKATMMNAEITGNITANGGKIGPFSIDSSSLNSGKLKLTSDHINYNNNGIISFLGANYTYENGFSTSLFIENNTASTLGSIKNCATFKRGDNKVIIGDDNSIINVVSGYSRFKGLLFNVRTMSGYGNLNYNDCIVICNATSKIDLYLPSYPRDGQVIWVTETTNVDCGVLGNGNKVFRNGTLYNWAQIRNNKSMLMFIYSGSYWIVHEYAGGSYSYGNG